MMRHTGTTLRKVVGVVRDGGVRAILQRVTRRAYARWGDNGMDVPLRDGDVADSTRVVLDLPPARPPRRKPLVIGWVTLPPSAGSGGHTTLFRMIEAAENAGHDCRIYLYDPYNTGVAQHESVLRAWWPRLRATVHNASDGIEGVDACVASSWISAHVLAQKAASPMRYLYFIQDFEPYFYARGAEYALAEDTYKFGFRCIALGEMVASELRSEIGIEPDVVEFGCDVSVYHPKRDSRRDGIVLYARPGTPRRGFWLARLALAQFHALRPDVPIHTYGHVVADLPFPAVQHGRMSPVELNDLYNRCVAGIALSFTNISLVAEEMLAAGVVPVVNDSQQARADLQNGNVVWSRPTPQSIAEALSCIVSEPPRDPVAMHASVRQFGWRMAQSGVVRILEEEVYDEQADPSRSTR